MPLSQCVIRRGRTAEHLDRADFDYDEKQDVYICATGNTLTMAGRGFSGNTLYSKDVCPISRPVIRSTIPRSGFSGS